MRRSEAALSTGYEPRALDSLYTKFAPQLALLHCLLLPLQGLSTLRISLDATLRSSSPIALAPRREYASRRRANFLPLAAPLIAADRPLSRPISGLSP